MLYKTSPDIAISKLVEFFNKAPKILVNCHDTGIAYQTWNR